MKPKVVINNQAGTGEETGWERKMHCALPHEQKPREAALQVHAWESGLQLFAKTASAQADVSQQTPFLTLIFSDNRWIGEVVWRRVELSTRWGVACRDKVSYRD